VILVGGIPSLSMMLLDAILSLPSLFSLINSLPLSLWLFGSSFASGVASFGFVAARSDLTPARARPKRGFEVLGFGREAGAGGGC